jgi:hypothetical protein
MSRGPEKIVRVALVVSFTALGVAVLSMVWLTIAAVIGVVPWGTWAFGLVLTGALALFLGRIRHRMNSAASSSDTKDDQA